MLRVRDLTHFQLNVPVQVLEDATARPLGEDMQSAPYPPASGVLSPMRASVGAQAGNPRHDTGHEMGAAQARTPFALRFILLVSASILQVRTAYRAVKHTSADATL